MKLLTSLSMPSSSLLLSLSSLLLSSLKVLIIVTVALILISLPSADTRRRSSTIRHPILSSSAAAVAVDANSTEEEPEIIPEVENEVYDQEDLLAKFDTDYEDQYNKMLERYERRQQSKFSIPWFTIIFGILLVIFLIIAAYLIMDHFEMCCEMLLLRPTKRRKAAFNYIQEYPPGKALDEKGQIVEYQPTYAEIELYNEIVENIKGFL